MTNDRLPLIACACMAAALVLVSAEPALCAQPAAPPSQPGGTEPAKPAAAPVFPLGSHVGLVPPPGMTVSKTFPGFADPAKNAGIIINELPPGAYDEMEKSLTDDALKKRGITVKNRETLQFAYGNADLVIGTQTGADQKPYRKWLMLVPAGTLAIALTVQAPDGDPAYSDSIVHAALETLTFRKTVPDEEFLGLLPFKVGDFAGFHISNTIPGRALLLIDAPKNPHLVVTQGLPEYTFDARFIITALPGNPPPDQRPNLARTAFDTIGGLKDMHFTMAEPVRIDNQEGFETVASAKDTDTSADLMVIQWLRFGGNGFLQMIGVSRADIWNAELSRLRTIRDSIDFK